MCGIFGVYLTDTTASVSQDVLREMGAAIRHRGPDDDGFFCEGPLGFGMRRLSIIDLNTGHQPIHNEDGSLQVVFNGEIYNYQELVHRLRQRGHSFYTTSDTEVIVHLYEEYGQDCVQHLRGMFAFAVWDRNTRALFLARDRVGIKPLYYASLPSGLLFASELKSMLHWPQFPREINPEALLAYLQYSYVPDPLSIFRRVAKLPPGHCLVVRQGVAAVPVRYWDPAQFFEAPRQLASESALCEELQWQLREAVKSHLVSDVPLGAFLSGGIDSSVVVALMARELGHPVKTFSIGFREEAFNELPYARLLAERLGTEHHELIVGPDSVDRLEEILAYFDEPFADASAIPTYLVSQLAREHVKVVLTGEGGDELFAGYERYLWDYQQRNYDLVSHLGVGGALRRVSEFLPEGTFGKNFLFNKSLPRIERYLDGISYFPPRWLKEIVSADLLAAGNHAGAEVFAPHIERSRDLGFPTRLQYLDLKTYLPGDVLTKADRMSMAHSLEARVPLLDHGLVEFAATIPAHLKLRDGQTKYIFKQAIQGLIPEEIILRKKQGFGVPLEYWVHDGLHALLQERVLGGTAVQDGYFQRSSVEKLFALYTATGRAEYVRRLWELLVFEVWYHKWMR